MQCNLCSFHKIPVCLHGIWDGMVISKWNLICGSWENGTHGNCQVRLTPHLFPTLPPSPYNIGTILSDTPPTNTPPKISPVNHNWFCLFTSRKTAVTMCWGSELITVYTNFWNLLSGMTFLQITQSMTLETWVSSIWIRMSHSCMCPSHAQWAEPTSCCQARWATPLRQDTLPSCSEETTGELENWKLMKNGFFS